MYQINENVKLVINSKKLTHPTPPFCSMKNWDLVDAFVYAAGLVNTGEASF